MAEQLCKNCRFWRFALSHPVYHGACDIGNAMKHGECRRRAPVPDIPIVLPNTPLDKKGGNFPLTNDNDFCGEFEQKGGADA